MPLDLGIVSFKTGPYLPQYHPDTVNKDGASAYHEAPSHVLTGAGW